MSRVFKNISFLFLAQFFGFLIPIIEIPVLTRALGLDAYGKILMVQSVALLAALFVEYGFGISGCRQVALANGCTRTVSRIYGEVMTAKLIIMFFVILLACIAVLGLELELERKIILCAGAYFLAFGLSPMWLFAGMERVAAVLGIELILRIASLMLLIALVRNEDDLYTALYVMALCAFINTFLSNLMAMQLLDKLRFSIAGSLDQIRSGYHVFIYKSANNILMNAGPVLVSLNGGAQALAAYIPAEKVIKGLLSIAGPVLVAIFPMMNRQLAVPSKATMLMPLIISGCVLFLSTLVAIFFTVAAEVTVRWALGEGFHIVSTVLKIFIWIVPLRLVNQTLGMTLLIPMGMDKKVGFITLLFSIGAVVLALAFSMKYGAAGAAAGFVIAEFCLFIVFIFYVARLWVKERYS